MTVVTTNMVKPITGKSQLAQDRMRRAAKIYEKHGGKVRIVRFLMGAYAGNMALQSAASDFTTSMSVADGVINDSSFVDLMQERESEPAAEMIGPFLFRTIYGDIAWDTHPVSQMRAYQMPRKNVPAAVQILGEVDQLTDEVEVAGVAPVVSEDMTLILATYQFTSIADYGVQLDKVGMSDAFQQIVNKASELGTLVSSSVYMTI